ncbi:MAG: chemotaxis protein CheX [Bdellovibrionota bacterium]
MDDIIFLRPNENLKEAGQNAIAKMKGIFSVELNSHEFKNPTACAEMIERGLAKIIFCEDPLDKANLNSLVGIFERAKNKPILVVSGDNFLALKEMIPKTSLCKITEFNRNSLFTCLRNFIVPPNQKLDVRYFQSMLNGVMEVIRDNTQENLTPGKLFEGKDEGSSQEYSAVVAFCGDGFLGSATVTTSDALIHRLALKMLGCEENDLTQELLEDVLLELANQILGVVRAELSEVGYELKSSMQVVVGGSEHWGISSSNGIYYTLPFTLDREKFNFKLCYNTYRASISEIEHDSAGFGKPLLDIRMLNDIIELVCTTFSSNLSLNVSWSLVNRQSMDLYETHSIHLFHASGFQGNILAMLDIPYKTGCDILKHMMGMEEEDVTAEMVNDTCGELLNQICGPLLAKCGEYGYKLQRVFHGDFAGKSNSKYTLKNPGYYLRVKFLIEDQPFFLCFGMDSRYGDSVFDVWDYYQSLPEFNKQQVE